MNRSRMVETTLLRRILVVIRRAHCVAVGPLYESFSPPLEMCTWCVSAFLGLIDTTICPYLTILPAGTPDWWINKVLFFPLMRFHTPSANLSISLENDVVQVPLSGMRISYMYPCVFPVARSIIPWKEMAPSPAVSTVCLACAHDRRGYL